MVANKKFWNKLFDIIPSSKLHYIWYFAEKDIFMSRIEYNPLYLWRAPENMKTKQYIKVNTIAIATLFNVLCKRLSKV